MDGYKNNILERITHPILCEYPFFLVIAVMLWQNTLFALNKWTFYGVAQYTFLSFFYSYIATVFVHLIGLKFLKVFIYALCFIICSINVFLRFCFSSNISPNVFQLIMETNYQETKEFFVNYVWTLSMSGLFLLLIAFVVVIFIVEKKKHVAIRSVHWLWNIIPLSIIIGGFVSFCLFINIFKCKNAIEVDYWIESHDAKAMDNLSNIIYCVFDLYLCNIEIDKAVASTQQVMMKDAICNTKDSLNVVLVIGESYIKWHAGVYGYVNNTTPHLQEELNKGNLFLFNDVVSPYNFTSKTLRNVLSINCISLKESWSDYPFFPTIFRKAGYEVTFWDNQYNPVSREGFDFSLNSYIHNPTISSITYSATNKQNRELDGELVDDFISDDVSRKGRLHFSIFHLMGQHVAYYNRFPHGGEFDYFNADSIQRNDFYLNRDKRQMIADYDNATRYNDYVIGSIINFYRDKNSVLVYLSDHGEEVYDYQDFYGRNWKEPLSNDLLRYQFEVPFMIWCSDTYIKKNPDTVSLIMSAFGKPLMLDNVCHLMMHVANIKSCYYQSERDVLSESYKCPPRILNDKYDVKDVRKGLSFLQFIR